MKPLSSQFARQFARQLAIVFGLWTLIALSTGLADYAFRLSIGQSPAIADVLRRPLIEQWIWAALTPLVFELARRFPLAQPALGRALCLHAVFFVALSLLHCLIAEAIGGPMASVPAHYQGSLLKLRFLEEFYSDIWMYWPLVGIRALIDAHARERERQAQANRLEHLLAGSRLALLRAQIQPHFLFNTLHAITALMRIDPRAAEDMLADLADILRTSFADPTSQETSLRSELDLVDCYLRIQQRRLGDRLRLVRRIEPDTLDAAVPALVLQSLVENAVVHGIASLSRPGTVSLSARREGDHLWLEVHDDGAGLLGTHHSGVGLANARERLQQLYGPAQSFELGSAAGQGTRVTLRIPYRVPARDAARGALRDEHPHTDRGRRTAGAAEPVVPAGS